jgi:adenylate kinase family enzyme
MLVVLIGLPCSGKKTVAEQLVARHGFEHVRLDVNEKRYAKKRAKTTVFSDATCLLNYATKNWTARMVTTDLEDHTAAELENLLGRPWVLLVAVEAGVGVRWQRAQQRSRLSCSTV